MHWQTLAKNALLGTENSTIPSATQAWLDSLGLDSAAEPPQLLANAAAMLSQMRKAGFQLADFQGEMPRPTTASSAVSHSIKSVQLLKLMLNGAHFDVLPEYFRLLKKHGKTLPTSEIPALMRLKEPPLTWNQIRPTLGEVGLWLMQQHPEWSKLLEDTTSFDWQTGNRTERLKLFDFWRKVSPSLALSRLKTTWETETPTDKPVFLAKLDANLSLEDEPFLETALDDKRKEVRQIAAVLLAKLPGSLLSQRMEKRAESLLVFKNGKLAVQIWEEPDASAQRDGIQHLQLDWAGGAKAAQLGQVVSRVSPSHWEVYFQKPPSDIIQLFDQTDWQQTLRQALINAVGFHKNEDWATHLSEHLMSDEAVLYGSYKHLDLVLKLLPDAEAHRFALHKIRHCSELPVQQTVINYLMHCNSAQWPDELSLLIINQFRKDIFKDYRQLWQLQHLQDWLKLLGLRCDPARYDQLQTGWSSDAVQWRYWEKPVEDMLAKVLFRRELQAELSK
ncbi:MAG: DUF5691 domain-containing protein [Saprospiraceae bacterium]|nr:DUF5691 domain-containing protein [Saprospiraceae bacterium]